MWVEYEEERVFCLDLYNYYSLIDGYYCCYFIVNNLYVINVMIRNYNIRCYNDFILIIDVFCKKVNWEIFLLM